MKKIKIVLSITLCFLTIEKVGAQIDVIAKENMIRIDSAERNVNINYCGGDIIYTNNFNNLYLKNDLSSLSFINNIFTNNKTINKLLLYKKKIRGGKN